MHWLHSFFDFLLHPNVCLDQFTQEHGLWVYLILFLVIFCETGLVVTPLLPGDSLLFAAGALAASPTTGLNAWTVWVILYCAAVSGDSSNYWIGNLFGPKWLKREHHPRLLKKEYLDRTHAFFQKYGGKTIILCRFVPIVRTFAPFMAGVGQMGYFRFLSFSASGSIAWISLFVWGGFWFGNLAFVRDHFALVELAIIIISIMPMVIEFIRARRENKKEQTAAAK